MAKNGETLKKLKAVAEQLKAQPDYRNMRTTAWDKAWEAHSRTTNETGNRG